MAWVVATMALGGCNRKPSDPNAPSTVTGTSSTTPGAMAPSPGSAASR